MAGNLARLAAGSDLYRYDGQTFPPRRDTGPAPACRVEVSPTPDRRIDLFLHVLTATDSSFTTVPVGELSLPDGSVVLTLGEITVSFSVREVGGHIAVDGSRRRLADKVDPRLY